MAIYVLLTREKKQVQGSLGEFQFQTNACAQETQIYSP